MHGPPTVVIGAVGRVPCCSGGSTGSSLSMQASHSFADPSSAVGLPRNQLHQYVVVPTNDMGRLVLEVQWLADGPNSPLEAWVLIKDLWGTGEATCNVRHIAFTQGISVAKATQQLKKVEIRYPKRAPRE